MTAPELLTDDDENPTVDTSDAEASFADDASAELDGAPVETTDEPDAPADDAPAVETATTEPVMPEPVPFAVNVFGKAYQLPGASFQAAQRQIQFASDKDFDRARQLLTKGREYETVGRQELQAARAELHRLKNEPDEEKTQAQVYLQEFRQLMTMSEQELYDFCSNARMNWPKIEAKADRAYAERLREQARTAATPPEPDVDVIVEQAQDGAAQFIQKTLANEPWATPDVCAELTTLLSDRSMLGQFVYRTDRDIPEYGVRAGQWVADWDRANALLMKLTQPYQRAATTAQAATQRVQTTQAVAQTNARSLARAKPPAPAAPPTKKPAPKPRPQDVVRDAMAVWKGMQG